MRAQPHDNTRCAQITSANSTSTQSFSATTAANWLMVNVHCVSDYFPRSCNAFDRSGWRDGAEFNSLINSAILQKGDRLILIQLKCDPVRRPHYSNLVALMRMRKAICGTALFSRRFFFHRNIARAHTQLTFSRCSHSQNRKFSALWVESNKHGTSQPEVCVS